MSAASAVAAALSERAEQVCRRYLPHGRKQGRYWTAGDIHGARGRSLFVRLAPPGVCGKWTDYVAPAIMLRSGVGRRSCALFAVSPQHNLSPAGRVYARGYAELIPRIRALADIAGIPAGRRAPLTEALKNHERHLAARGRIEDYLVRAERHIEAHGSLRREALDGDIEVAQVAGYPAWKRDADGLIRAGEAILADKQTYGAHLAKISTAETRIEWALTDIARTVRQDDAALREAAALREELEEIARDKPDPREAARERARQAERDAREYSRLQSAVHNARSQQEREAAQKAFDDYRKREAHKYEEPGERQRQSHTRKRSRHWRMRP